MKTEHPLVSCIMPTRNRRDFVPLALRYFLRQDYPYKELVVVDDGEDRIDDLLPRDHTVRYIYLDKPCSIGVKRNIAIDSCKGDIILHWDDDDWFSSNRISLQVQVLLDSQPDHDVCGLDRLIFFDILHQGSWLYVCPENVSKPWLAGGTLCYKKKFWEKKKFDDLTYGEDTQFLWSREDIKLFPIQDFTFYVAMIHPGNTIPKDVSSGCSQSCDLHRCQEIMGSDYRSYLDVHCIGKEPVPLVSCIMPTYNRRAFVPKAAEYFLRQDYPKRELIVVDDGTDPVEDLLPKDPRIRCLRLNKKHTTGAKRNLACKKASGEIIVHWDDDDWMAPHRLSYQVENLIKEKAEICGLDNLFFFDPLAQKAWHYIYPKEDKPWLAGGTFCYTKTYWNSNPFPDIKEGEDTRFLWSKPPKKMIALQDNTFYAALVHKGNTSSKCTTDSRWHSHNIKAVHDLMGEDLGFYQSVLELKPVSPVKTPITVKGKERMRKKVTIAIFVHNEIPLLKRTLRSLRENTEYPYQLIIVDDGSDIEAGGYLRTINNIELIRNSRRMGYSHCANIVIDHSKTPYILFLDSAVRVAKHWLTLLIDRLEEDPGHGIAGPSTNLAWGEQSIQPNPYLSAAQVESFANDLRKKYGNRFQYLDELHNVNSFCYCFKREIVDKIGYFDEAYGLGQCEDIDYNTRAAQAGYKALWVCAAYVHRYPMQRFGPDAGMLLEKNKKIYQNKFCALQIEKRRTEYCSHCLGEKSEFFTRPKHLKKVVRHPQQFTISSHRDIDTGTTIQPGNEYPLVSCIMPTSDRSPFVPQAIEYFLRQDYPNKELIIVDDGNQKIGNLIPPHTNIRYFELKQRKAIGEKRNIAIEKSRGSIIMHWDDDDYYAPGRISYQVQPLLKNEGDLCALRPGLYYDIKMNVFWRCRRDLHEKLYYGGIMGGSMTYKKRIWERYTRFPSCTGIAEDASFLKQLPHHVKIIKLPNLVNLVYVRHNQNTWRFTCGLDVDRSGWLKVLPPREIGPGDMKFYQNLRRQLFYVKPNESRRFHEG